MADVVEGRGSGAFLNPLNYLFKPGLAGGQTAAGGTAAGNTLDFIGNNNVSEAGGRINLNAAVEISYSEGNISPAEQVALRWRPSFTTAGAYIGGFIGTAADITYTNGFFIYGLLLEQGVYRAAVAPGFAAFTLFNALPRIVNSGNFDLVNALVLNVGVVHERETLGTSIAATVTGMNFSPQTKASVSGAVMTKTNQSAITVTPTFSSVSGSTVNLGTIRGVHCNVPSVALFQPQLGTETLTAYVGLDFDNMAAFGGNVIKAAVRSAHAAATNSYFLLNNGTARSSFGSSNIEFNDLFGVVLGTSQDLGIGWSASNFLFFNFALTGGQVRISNPTAGNTTDRYLIEGDLQDSEFNINCDRFSLGAQSGATGNQVGAFVTPTRTAAIGGEWSDFLLTQAGNITVDAALGLVAGWTVNAPSITLGTGSVTTGVGLNVGGNPNQGTNRAGVRIISNPSGGAGVNAALWITAGNTQLDGDLTHTGTNVGFYGATPVPQAAAYTVTNVTTDRAYDANLTSLNELADVVGTLIADLQNVGLVG